MAEFHEIAGYEVMATLGQGARSTIYAVRDPKGNVFALKRVVKNGPSDERFMAQAIAEHEVAKHFDHELLRRSYKIIRQRNFIRTSEILVLMELVDGLSLEHHQPANLEALCDICRQAAEGLGVMHKDNYVHADIKPNNIMVTDGDRVKLIDFGQSCKNGTIKERIQGTPDYIAPEQVHRKAITPQTDIFNLGATMYWMLTGKHVPTEIPKKQAGVALKTEDHGRCIPPREVDDRIPPALSSLVMECVERKPMDRPQSMKHIMDRLEIARAQLQRERTQGRGESELDVA